MKMRHASLAVLVAAPLLLGGCSLLGGGSSGNHGGGGDGSGTGGGPSTTKKTKPQKNQTVVSGSGDTTDGTMQVKVTEFRREGKELELAFTLHYKASGDADEWDYPAGNSRYNSATGANSDASATNLVDGKNGKEYLPAMDSQGNCVCTIVHYGSISIEPGKSRSIQATYGAPPSNVTKMDIHIPDVTTLHDVPIS